VSNENQYIRLQNVFAVSSTSVKCTFSANTYEFVASVMPL